MNTETIVIDSEYIELARLLKHAGLTGTGGEAKMLVQSGQITVDGEVETRRRKKIRPGQSIAFEDNTILIKAES